MKKILIADDHVEIRELIKETLCNEDFEIHLSENGKKAVQLAKEEKPDIIVMDIMMPGRINGLEATKIIKSEPECKNCKVIILSAKDQDKDKISALKAGASAFVVKPFRPEELLKKIKSLLF